MSSIDFSQPRPALLTRRSTGPTWARASSVALQSLRSRGMTSTEGTSDFSDSARASALQRGLRGERRVYLVAGGCDPPRRPAPHISPTFWRCRARYLQEVSVYRRACGDGNAPLVAPVTKARFPANVISMLTLYEEVECSEGK
jgi:hypothetical protein